MMIYVFFAQTMIYAIEVKVRARTAKSVYSNRAMWKTLEKSRLTSNSGKTLFLVVSAVQLVSY